MPKKQGSTAATSNCICLLQSGEVPKFVEPTVAALKLHLPGLYAEVQIEIATRLMKAVQTAANIPPAATMLASGPPAVPAPSTHPSGNNYSGVAEQLAAQPSGSTPSS